MIKGFLTLINTSKVNKVSLEERARLEHQPCFPGMVTIYITETEDGKRKVRTSTLQSLLVIVLYLSH